MAMKNEIDAPTFLTAVIVSALLLLVTVIAVDAWYKTQEQEEVAAKWEESPNTWLQNLRAEQQGNLEIAHRINNRHYHVPVSEAMRILAEGNGKVPTR